jgi:hypothetical protein
MLGGEMLFEGIGSFLSACFVSFTREEGKASRMPNVNSRKIKEEDP